MTLTSRATITGVVRRGPVVRRRLSLPQSRIALELVAKDFVQRPGDIAKSMNEATSRAEPKFVGSVRIRPEKVEALSVHRLVVVVERRVLRRRMLVHLDVDRRVEDRRVHVPA